MKSQKNNCKNAKKTLAQNKVHSYNDDRMSVQVKMTKGKEVKYV